LLPAATMAQNFAQAASHLVGYTIVAVKTAVSFKDKGKDLKDGFEGCEFDRVIVFDDNTYLVCRSYGYHYAYRPEAVLLAGQNNWKMVIDGEVFDVSTR